MTQGKSADRQRDPGTGLFRTKHSNKEKCGWVNSTPIVIACHPALSGRNELHPPVREKWENRTGQQCLV